MIHFWMDILVNKVQLLKLSIFTKLNYFVEVSFLSLDKCSNSPINQFNGQFIIDQVGQGEQDSVCRPSHYDYLMLEQVQWIGSWKSIVVINTEFIVTDPNWNNCFCVCVEYFIDKDRTSNGVWFHYILISFLVSIWLLLVFIIISENIPCENVCSCKHF